MNMFYIERVVPDPVEVTRNLPLTQVVNIAMLEVGRSTLQNMKFVFHDIEMGVSVFMNINNGVTITVRNGNIVGEEPHKIDFLFYDTIEDGDDVRRHVDPETLTYTMTDNKRVKTVTEELKVGDVIELRLDIPGNTDHEVISEYEVIYCTSDKLVLIDRSDGDVVQINPEMTSKYPVSFVDTITYQV